MAKTDGKKIVIVPAYNEEANIEPLIDEIGGELPGVPILIINDGSRDFTAAVARKKGVIVLDLPFNLGVGGAVQAGFLYAYEQGYDYAIRCDGDGQHAPSSIKSLLAAMDANDVDLVVGSRFLSEKSYTSTIVRQFGIAMLARFLTLICRRRVTDPTSGFHVLNRPLLYFFSCNYPVDYPEPEALALMRRHGFDFMEVPAEFRSRKAGRSSIGSWDTLYYAFKVFIALFIDRARPAAVQCSKDYLKGKV
ncbi:MAG: glycosyl transferase family 2 [Verrucomicrobia bacterium]|nr:glycosyl transferase family 2 [Verrucomicrobiota bacterium]